MCMALLRAIFVESVSRVVPDCIGFVSVTLRWNSLENWYHFLDKFDAKPRTILTFSLAFPALQTVSGFTLITH